MTMHNGKVEDRLDAIISASHASNANNTADEMDINLPMGIEEGEVQKPPRDFPEVEIKKVPSQVEAYKGTDITDDYMHSRNVLYGLIDKGNSALEGALDLAKESEHPRAFNVCSDLIKNVTDVTKELMNLQKLLRDVTKDSMGGNQEETPNGTGNTNIMFNGSTADLQAFMKANMSSTGLYEGDAEEVTVEEVKE